MVLLAINAPFQAPAKKRHNSIRPLKTVLPFIIIALVVRFNYFSEAFQEISDCSFNRVNDHP